MGDAEYALLEALLFGGLACAATVPWLALAAVQGSLQRRAGTLGLDRRPGFSLRYEGPAGPEGPVLRVARLLPRCRLELAWPAALPAGFTLWRADDPEPSGPGHYRTGDARFDACWRMGRQGDLALLAPEVRAALVHHQDQIHEISGGRIRSRAGLRAKDWPARRASLEAVAAALLAARARKALTLEGRAQDPDPSVRRAAARLLTPGRPGGLAVAEEDPRGGLTEAPNPDPDPPSGAA